jgi:hypothetical protein
MDTDYKSATLEDIIKSEYSMVKDGASLYGDYYKNALALFNLLQNFLLNCSAEKIIFCSFLGQIKKHSLLAILSALRRQDTQAMMNLRQVLESSALAAYSIAEGDYNNFLSDDNEEIIKNASKFKNDAYKWLNKNYKKGSDSIHAMKKLINKSSAHANILISHKNIRLNSEGDTVEIPFFDFKDEYLVKTALWQTANIIMGVLDLFYGINKEYKAIQFIPDFPQRLKTLERLNMQLRNELMQNNRYKRTITHK